MKTNLAAQVAQIRAEVAQANKDYDHFGGLGYATPKRQQVLLAYVAQLEKVIDGVIDDLECIYACSDEKVISDVAKSAQGALCEAYGHEAYRAEAK